MNDLSIWQAKLRGEAPPLHNDRPVPGFFRIIRGGRAQRVAFWISNDELLGEVDGDAIDPKKLWPSVMRGEWIPYADYEFHLANGRFPDEPPAPTIGDNNPPADEPAAPVDENPEYTRLIREVDLVLVKANILKVGTATEKEMADQMAALTLQMNALALDAETAHKIEKQPWLDGGRKIDERWSFSKRLRDLAKEYNDTIIRPILLRLRQKQEAEAAAAREEAARIAREVRQRQAEAEAAGRQAPVELPPPAPLPVEPARISAGIGRKQVALKDKEVVKVTDKKAFAAYLLDRDDADLLAVLDKRAGALLRAKLTKDVPGLTVTVEPSL